jgi:DNA-binding response OmpR family regulator
MAARILCLGRNAELLKTRCAVLAHQGYLADAATIPEGFFQLRSEKYDLLIVSARLAEKNGKCLPADMPTLVLDGMVLPVQLLQEVARKLERFK